MSGLFSDPVVCSQLWDLRQPGCKVVEYRGHQQTTACCAFLPALPDGTVRVATSSHDSTIRIWDQNSAGGAHTHTSPDPVLESLNPAGVCDLPGWGTQIPAGTEPLRTGSGPSCMLRPISTFFKRSSRPLQLVWPRYLWMVPAHWFLWPPSTAAVCCAPASAAASTIFSWARFYTRPKAPAQVAPLAWILKWWRASDCDSPP